MRGYILPDDLFASEPEAVRTQGVGAKVKPFPGRTSPSGEVPSPSRLTAVAYLRVSTDQQAESGLGLEAQRASVTAAAARLGLQLRDAFVDAGVSGAVEYTARPMLVEAVTALRRGEVLLVAKRDRLGRDRFVVAMIERLVEKQRARIVSAAGEGTDNDEPANVLMRQMVDAFAHYERLLIAARTKAALATKREKHERAGELPYGFQLAHDGRRVHRRGCQARVPVEQCHCGGRVVAIEVAAVEQRIQATIDGMAALKATTQEITARLTAEGYTTRKGTPWRPAYVARRLRKVAG